MENMELPSRYDPKATEEKWLSFWLEKKVFHAEPDREGQPYTIVIPPPNVTGALHMGHALNNTIQDVLIRWRRMQGYNTLWMPGTDHAGIATQNVVERDLAKRGLSRKQMSREEFIKEVWAWKEKFGARIVEQLKRLGASCDWDRLRFTMDEGLSRAVREAFVRLYERGLLYRDKYIINWCPRCQTALADDEVEHEEHEGHLWFIKYPLKDDPSISITVATTRPETMLGDTAVAVHPEDKRYREFIGEKLILPIIEREVPIIADHFVDPSFGSGAVKVTPAHDPNDFEMGNRHGLPRVCVMNEDGTMNENAGEFAGMDRFECREALVEELKERKLLARVEEHIHSVGHCYRCHTVIEPYLSDQWFVRMRSLALAAIKLTERQEVTFRPPRWEKVYLDWLENVRDWCVSRQIWWGHQIPAWYCNSCGEITVTREDPDRCAHCQSPDIERDPDVLDTWFSSSLWPFSTLGWPDETPELKRYFPTDVLVTDRGIIYFWVARMVMMSKMLLDEKPFSTIYIHGTILDEEGRKMSKSLGNGIDPIDMIEQYGADAVRFSLLNLTKEGQDVRLSESKFEMGRNFANKIWNAARFVLMNLETVPDCESAEVAFEDEWILSRARKAVLKMNQWLEEFQFNEACSVLYEFAWHDFCDWYVEIVKARLRGDGASKLAAQQTLVQVLDVILRLLHPFLPFVTEEIWQKLRAVQHAQPKLSCDVDWPESLVVAKWPSADHLFHAPQREREMAMIQEIVRGIRNIRSNMNIPDRTPISAWISVEADEWPLTDGHLEIIKMLATLSDVRMARGLQKPAASATHVVSGASVYVPLEGLIDIDRERARLRSKIEKAKKHLQIVSKKLQNHDFLQRAPEHVVQKEQQRKSELLAQIDGLEKSLEDLD